jgi:hypothetical protein
MFVWSSRYAAARMNVEGVTRAEIPTRGLHWPMSNVVASAMSR